MHKQFKFLFWLNALIHILSIILEIEWLRFITKPLLMIFLGLYFYYSVDRNAFTKSIMLAIIFSFGGDVALMFQDIAPIYFILGLASFLIAHLFYVYAMVKYPNFKQGFLVKEWWWSLPFLAYGIGLVTFLWSDLKEMTVPVIIYSITIMLMGLSALNMKGRVSKSVAIYILLGAILFILSDSVIALSKFKAEDLMIRMPNLIIMITYILGQFLIVEGVVKQETQL
ncbi:MAG: lysoplasmalogenase [Saprospiraceae bacterium]